MADEAVASRYAKAYVNALGASKKVQVGLEELKSVAENYRLLKEFQSFLGSPEIGQEKKWELMTRVWSDSVGPEGMGLLRLLLEWNRIDLLPAVALEAVRIAEAQAGLVRGQVTTARPISLAETEAIAKAVGTQLGKRVVLERAVDSKLLGGIRVAVGTLLIDRSIRRLLEEVHFHLKEIKVS